MGEKPGPSFAELLRQYRRAAGLSHEALAERANLSARGISDLERGLRRAPRADTVTVLAQALGLSAAEAEVLEAAVVRRRDLPRTGLANEDARPPLAEDAAPMAHPPLVGRLGELVLLERHLAGQGPPVLALSGESGIGKTRLLEEAMRRAVIVGWDVVSGGCGPHHQDPYAPLPRALERHIRAQPVGRRRTILRDCAWLVRMLPRLAADEIDPPPAIASAPDQERRLMVAALGRYLARVAGPAGTLLVLDDLQWAGPDALDVLATLVRSSPGTPLRVIAAYRDTDVAPADPLTTLLADWVDTGLGARHAVAPLAADESARLLEALLPRHDRVVDGHTPHGSRELDETRRARIIARAGGLPFFVISYVRGRDAQDGEGADAVPRTVTQSIRKRVAALPAAARAIMEVAAVAGRTISRRVLLAAAEEADGPGPASARPRMIQALHDARLLIEDGPDGYRFPHDLVREVVDGDLEPARRAILHGRVARALEEGPGDPPVEELAYHYGHTDDDDRAALYRNRAGDRAWARLAYASARDSYAAAVERLDRSGRVVEAARVREKLGTALDSQSRPDDALTVLEQATTAYHAAGDVEGMGRVLAQIAWVHATAGTTDGIVARILALLEYLEPRGPSRALAALYGVFAFYHYMAGRHREQLAAAERAVAVATAVGERGLRAEAAAARGMALFALGQFADALQVMRDAIPLADEAGHTVSLRTALGIAAAIHERRGEFASSQAYLARVLAIAEQQDDVEVLPNVCSSVSRVLFYAGDWENASAFLERAEGAARRARSRRAGIPPLLQRARLRLATGWEAEARTLLEEAATTARACADLPLLRYAEALLAECDLRAGEPEAARVRLSPLLADQTLDEWGMIDVVSALAWAFLESGATVEARALLADATAHARSRDDRLTLVELSRLRAMGALRLGQWADAEQALREGLSLARAMPYPYGEAHLLHTYGQLHTLRGNAEGARERLEGARAIFRRLGAHEAND